MPSPPPDFAADAARPVIAPDSRAIVLTQVTELGGAERACLALARWLHRKGIPTHFVTYKDTVGLDKATDHPLTVVQLRPTMRSIYKVLALRRYFQSRPDLPKPMMSGYQPALHATLAGLRGFHCLMHDTPSLFSDAGEHRSLRRRIQRSISDRATGIGLRSGGKTIVTSTYLRNECRRVFDVGAVIARMGGLGSLLDFQPHAVADTLRLFSVSRVESNKRIDWILRSLSTLQQTSPEILGASWQLDVAGRGAQLEQMKRLAADLNLEKHVTFHGFVSDEDLGQLYREADLFLMPAVQGYGIPAIEALQRGIPVLLHRSSGVSDILLDTPWATVFDGGEERMTAALASAIRGVREARQLQFSLPVIPSEDSWAEEVARLCGWL